MTVAVAVCVGEKTWREGQVFQLLMDEPQPGLTNMPGLFLKSFKGLEPDQLPKESLMFIYFFFFLSFFSFFFFFKF